MKWNIWNRKYQNINEKIAYLQYSRLEFEFRKKFSIPNTGFQNDWKKRETWFKKLTDSETFVKYDSDLKKLGKWFDLTEKNEISSLEEYLVMGTYPVIFAFDNTRTRVESSNGSKNKKIWLRIDGLSEDQIYDEIERIKISYPNAINKNSRKPTRRWENIMLHQKIYILSNQGKSANKISDELTESRYKAIEQMPETMKQNYLNKELDVSVENVKQSLKRYKKRMKLFFKKKGQIKYNL